MHQMRRITLLSSVSSLHLLLKVFLVSAITAESRCQGYSQGWEQRGGETGKVLPGERRVIMSTMASLINDEDSAQSGQLSAENWRIYIFHCSVPHEVSVLCSYEEVNMWSRLLTQTGSWGNIITVIIKCHEWVTLGIIMLVTSQVTVTCLN